jgi:hypothetical protein
LCAVARFLSWLDCRLGGRAAVWLATANAATAAGQQVYFRADWPSARARQNPIRSNCNYYGDELAIGHKIGGRLSAVTRLMDSRERERKLSGRRRASPSAVAAARLWLHPTAQYGVDSEACVLSQEPFTTSSVPRAARWHAGASCTRVIHVGHVRSAARRSLYICFSLDAGDPLRREMSDRLIGVSASRQPLGDLRERAAGVC